MIDQESPKLDANMTSNLENPGKQFAVLRSFLCALVIFVHLHSETCIWCDERVRRPTWLRNLHCPSNGPPELVADNAQIVKCEYIVESLSYTVQKFVHRRANGNIGQRTIGKRSKPLSAETLGFCQKRCHSTNRMARRRLKSSSSSCTWTLHDRRYGCEQ